MSNKLSASEVFNQLQANCDFVEKSVNIELHNKGRINLLIFNYTALLSILDEKSINNDLDFFHRLTNIIKSEVSIKLNINNEDSENYVFEKIDEYEPFIVKLSHREEIAFAVISDFFVGKIDIEHVMKFDLSLILLKKLIVIISKNLDV